MGVPNVFGSATTSIPLTQLDANFNTTATLGNTAIGLGNVTTSVGNLTLTNVNIVSGTSNLASGSSIVNGTSNVVVVSSGGNVTVATNNAERMRITTAGDVGIGRTPDQRLQIAQSSAVEFDMFVGTTRTLSFYADATQSIIAAPTAIPMIFKTNDTEQARISSAGFFQFNSGYGSVVPAYGCRAWVNFDGTGTIATRGSGNVSSLGDNGTGDYTVNFATAMPDSNYALSGGASRGSGDTSTNGPFSVGIYQATVPATGSVRIQTGYGGSQASAGSNQDAVYVCVAIHR